MPAQSVLDGIRSLRQKAGMVPVSTLAADAKARQIAREPGEDG